MTYSDSDIYSVVSGALTGVAILNPLNPSESARLYPFGNIGRKETVTVSSVRQEYLTFVHPEVSFSQQESNTLALSITIPHSDTHTAEVRDMRAVVRARKGLIYRDNRGRFLYGVLTAVTITDLPEGTNVSGTLIVSNH